MARRGARVFVRAVAAWIMFLALSYVALSTLYVDLERLAARLGVEWEGMPFGLSARQVMVGSWGLAALGVAAGVQLWRMKQSGRAFGIAYLGFVGLYAVVQAWLQREVMAAVFGVFNLWVASVLLRKDVSRVYGSGRGPRSQSAA